MSIRTDRNRKAFRKYLKRRSKARNIQKNLERISKERDRISALEAQGVDTNCRG